MLYSGGLGAFKVKHLFAACSLVTTSVVAFGQEQKSDNAKTNQQEYKQ